MQRPCCRGYHAQVQILPIFAAAWQLQAAQLQPPEPDEQRACWTWSLSRSACCYGGSGSARCFRSSEEAKRCCSPRLVKVGPSAFLGLPFPDEPSALVHYLQHLMRLDRLRAAGHLSPVSAAHYISKALTSALHEIMSAQNMTSATPGQLPSVDLAYHVTMKYFLSLEVLKRKTSSASGAALLRREAALWYGFTEVYRSAWGVTDFCRCVEAAEFYSRLTTALQQAGIGRADLGRVFLNATLPEHQALQSQTCSQYDEEELGSDRMGKIAFSSQCMPGDLALSILLLQSCILEQDMRKVLALQRSIFELSTFAADCLDSEHWGFNVRDAAVQNAKVVWELARRPSLQGVVPMDSALQSRLAWARHRNLFSQNLGATLTPTRSSPGAGMEPWHQQCGPHTHLGSLRLSAPQAAHQPSTLGPLCNELGRFWLKVHLEQTSSLARLRTLAVIPITMSWEANPWHHLHWWIPAISYFKVSLKLSSDDLDIALVFPHVEADWAMSTSTARSLHSRSRTEPEDWSILQHAWPFTTEESMMHWRPEGIHADVLAWLSSQPAVSLAECYGKSYRSLILGLPPLRVFVQTPRMTCTDLAAVRSWVQSTPKFAAAASSRGQLGESETTPRRLLRLAIIQRARSDGRRISNLEEVLDVVLTSFSGELEAQVIRGLVHGTPFVEQFRLLTDSDVLLAVHGAGLAWLWVLRAGGAAIELRSRGSPVWLQCSETWNADGSEIFGGLARLAGIHHFCARPHDMAGSTSQARLSKIGDMDDRDAYNHSDDVYVLPAKAEVILRSAVTLVTGAPLPCVDFKWW
eukprot:TRINITY_DN29364_c0_g1_i1.p1 TRINITY_DN29364_c0_g1~~TRINITY_DN29364_c0_g1_i1.p1  ORF type:complete len:806 (+),score=142.25 TRINITY_DN29364_c0_g1_i1:107-2524(+)